MRLSLTRRQRIRNPPRDAMLSYAGSVIGQGWTFALREALDQTGAMVGPLVVAVILLVRQDAFREAYAWLLLPALLTLLTLGISRRLFPRPRALERQPRLPGRRRCPAPSGGT